VKRSRLEGVEEDVPPVAPRPGCSDDFETVFRRSYAPLVRSLSRIAAEAPDAVQEALVQAHLHWDTVGHFDDPVAWIRRVAINRLLDAERGRGRRARLVERLAQVRPVRPVGGGTIEVQEALERLPPRQRLIITLFYLDDMSIEDIAVTLGCSPGTVKSALHRGRRNLKKLLEVP
jgi:RNA polymerase sigma-70 factor (ECF subfamily)